MAGPEVGTIEDGYRFKGGDPKQESSWEQVAPIDVSSDYGPGARRYPNGTLVRVGPKGGVTPITNTAAPAAGGSPLVGADARARYMIGLGPLQDAKKNFDEAEASGNPIDRDWGAAFIDRATEVPFLARIGDTIARKVGGEDYQKYVQAASTYESALLPILSGAAVTESEALRLIRADLPQAGDSKEVLERKARNRAQRINAVAEGIGKPAPYDLNNLSATNEEDALAMIAGGLPQYKGIQDAVAGVSGGYDIGPDGNPIPPPNGPQPGDVSVTTQPLAPEDTPASLAAQGYVYDPARDTWSRSRQESVLNRTDWTPEGAVAQRREMWNPARQVDAFVRGAADATSLEFADEIAAGADALVGRGNGRTLGDRWRNNVRVQRAIDKADGEDAGFARNAGEVAGYGVAALTQGPRLLAQGARRFGSPLLNGAVTGIRNALTGGAIAGTAAAGAAEGNALQRAQEALKAAPVGAAAGVVTPVAVNALAPRIAAPVQAVNRFAGRQVGRLGEQLGVPGASRLTERATPSALASAVEQYGARIGDRRVSALADNVQRQRDLGFQPTLADAVDDAGQGQLRALASIDTPARDRAVAFGRQRRAGAQEDVSTIARRFVSDDPRTATRVARDLEEAQTAASGPAYEAARASPPITVSADIGEALFSGEGPSTIRAAGRAYRSSVRPEERALALELEGLAQAADEGVPAGDIQMSVGAADLLSRYLNKAGGNDANLSRIYQGLGRAIRRTARDQSPAYDAAVSGYAERAQLDDATDFGRRFLTRQGSEDFANEAAAMLPAQRDVARVAARDTLEDAGSTPGGAATLLDNLAIGRGAGQRGDALIPEAGLMRDTAEAARMRLQTGRNVDPRAGSNTNLNRQDTENVDSAVEFLGDGARIIASPIRGTIDVVARRFQNRGFNRLEAEELVNAALDPARTDDLVRMLSQRMTRREARTLARAVQRQVSSGSGSSSAEQ